MLTCVITEKNCVVLKNASTVIAEDCSWTAESNRQREYENILDAVGPQHRSCHRHIVCSWCIQAAVPALLCLQPLVLSRTELSVVSQEHFVKKKCYANRVCRQKDNSWNSIIVWLDNYVMIALRLFDTGNYFKLDSVALIYLACFIVLPVFQRNNCFSVFHLVSSANKAWKLWGLASECMFFLKYPDLKLSHSQWKGWVLEPPKFEIRLNLQFAQQVWRT